MFIFNLLGIPWRIETTSLPSWSRVGRRWRSLGLVIHPSTGARRSDAGHDGLLRGQSVIVSWQEAQPAPFLRVVRWWRRQREEREADAPALKRDSKRRRKDERSQALTATGCFCFRHHATSHVERGRVAVCCECSGKQSAAVGWWHEWNPNVLNFLWWSLHLFLVTWQNNRIAHFDVTIAIFKIPKWVMLRRRNTFRSLKN